MKDQSEIRKEFLRLIITKLEANLVYKYYTDQVTRMLSETIEKNEELTKSVRVEGLPDEEREKLRFQLRHAELEGQACKEATTIIRRLADKAYRKVNEAEQRLKAFCKRHGIENVDEYVKNSKS